MRILLLAFFSMAVAKSDGRAKIPVYEMMRLYSLEGKPLQYVVCHERMREPLRKALLCMKHHTDLLPMSYSGCFNKRNIAGTDRPSLHTYGIAIDLNVDIGVPERMALCFESAGFKWGGRWAHPKTDEMHFELPKE